MRIAAVAAEFGPAPAAISRYACAFRAGAGRLVLAISLWPDTLWFWLATATLVAVLAVLPPVPAAVSSADPSFPREARPENPPSNRGEDPFSQANVRFCRFQQVRLEAIGPLTDGADLAVFEALADDWNARCSRYGDLASDRRAIDSEVIERREALEQEGRGLLAAWRRKIELGAAAPAGWNPLRARHSEDVAGMRSLPALITMGVPGRVEAEPVSWPLLRTPGLALLRQSVAARVQRRLSDLGYVISPADGTWAPSSRNALRRFKEANGLLCDDVLDAETVTRLFSTSAVNAPGGWTGREDAAAFATAYEPPAGASMNPLNREDAERIQHRLAELGYYAGSDDGIWGAASRDALRIFRRMNGLVDDEEWDASTEQSLTATQALPSPEPAMLQRQKPRNGGLDARLEPPSARGAIPLPAKRPVRSAASTKLVRVPGPAAEGAPRPPAPIPAPALIAAREP